MIAYLRKTSKDIKRPAVFLDRDGTIIHDRPGFYLTDPRKLRFYADAFKALRILACLGYRLIVITNQSGVGRGYMTLARSKAINMKLVTGLRARGIELDGVYFCPHLPDAGCACRKPGLALLQKARKRFHLDFARSYFVGDSTTDVLTAKRAGCTAVLVRTGKAGRDGVYRAKPHRVCRDLAAAADWMLRAA